MTDFRTVRPTLEDVFLQADGPLDSETEAAETHVAWTLELTWLEIKIFVREPLGLIGTIGMPVLVFVVLGRMFGRAAATSTAARTS